MGTAIAEGILILLAGWLFLVLVTYPIMRVFTSPSNAAIGLIVAIFGPPIAVAVLIGGAPQRAESQRLDQENKQNEVKYAEYIKQCKNNTATIFHKAPEGKNKGVLVRDFENFKGYKGGGEKLAECLIAGQYVADRTICKRPNIDFIDVKYSCDNCNRYDRYLKPTLNAGYRVDKLDPTFMNLYTGHSHINIYSMYTRYGFWTPSDAVYELILGKLSDPPYSTNDPNMKIGVSTIELIRISDQLKLAELKMSFVNEASGAYGCSDYYVEVSKLLKAVF
jgi:hypothetical protein